MQILYVGNGNYKHRGARYYDVGRKIFNGLIRNGHNVYFLSDRDTSRSATLFGSRKLGIGYCNKVFLDTCYHFNPDLILLGHADIIRTSSLEKARAMLPRVRIAQFNVDAVFNPHTVAQIQSKAPFCDATFVTTAGSVLKRFSHAGGRASYIPNPVDASIEWPRCHERSDQENDVFWALRGTYGSPDNPRIRIPLYLEQSGQMKIDYHGMNGKPELLDARYFQAIANAKMGINLSSVQTTNNRSPAAPEELYLYSSDRIAHYMGSGLLTLAATGNRLEDLFTPDKEIVLFSSQEELLEKIVYFKEHDVARKKIAQAGWEKSHLYLNERLVARYIIETTLQLKLSEDYAWPTQTY